MTGDLTFIFDPLTAHLSVKDGTRAAVCEGFDEHRAEQVAELARVFGIDPALMDRIAPSASEMQSGDRELQLRRLSVIYRGFTPAGGEVRPGNGDALPGRISSLD